MLRKFLTYLMLFTMLVVVSSCSGNQATPTETENPPVPKGEPEPQPDPPNPSPSGDEGSQSDQSGQTEDNQNDRDVQESGEDAEEAARKKAEEEEARRLAEEAARKKAEEEEARRLAEEAARKKAEEEAKSLAEANAKETVILPAPPEEGDNLAPLNLDQVYFAYDQSELTDTAMSSLEESYEWIQENPDVRILIAGHADERGSEEYNLGLGERRAKAVLQYWILLGADEGQFEVISFGEERPQVEGSTEEAWSKNRRVEFSRY